MLSLRDAYLTTHRKDYTWPYFGGTSLRPPTASGNFWKGSQCSPRCLAPPVPYCIDYVPLGAPFTEAPQYGQPDGPKGPYIGDGSPYGAGTFNYPQYPPEQHVVQCEVRPTYPDGSGDNIPVARVGPAPEIPEHGYDQPNRFLQKLKERFPHLYSVQQRSPPDPLLMRVARDRFLTTYRKDFCKEGQYPLGNFGGLAAAGGMYGAPLGPTGIAGIESGGPGSNQPGILPDSTYRSTYKDPLSKIGRSAPFKPRFYTFESVQGSCRKAYLKMGISEYADGISKNGEYIISHRLHHPRKKKKY